MDIEANIEKKTRFYFFSFVAITSNGRKNIGSAVMRSKEDYGFFNYMEVEQALRKRISMNNSNIGVSGIVILNWKEIKNKEYLYFNSYSKREFDKDLEAPEKYVFHFSLNNLM